MPTFRMSRTLLAAVLASLVPAAPAAADTFIAAANDADLTASGDGIFWSERRTSGLTRLMTVDGGAVTALPVRPEPVSFAATPGTDRTGAPVLTYCRGTSTTCRSLHVFDVARRRERRLDVSVPRGCVPLSPSMERGAVVFVLAGSCKRRGVWLRSATGRLRRLAANDDACCTALVNGTPAWIGAQPAADVVFVKVAPPGRRPFVLYRSAHPIRGASTAGLVGFGGRLYWGVTAETEDGDFPRALESRVLRARPVPGAACEASDRSLPSRSRMRSSLSSDTIEAPAFAISARGLFYADRREIRLADGPPVVFSTRYAFGRNCRF